MLVTWAAAASSLVLPGGLRAPQVTSSPRIANFATMVADTVEEAVPVPAAFFETSPGLLNGKAEYEEMYKRSVEDPSGFWGDIASQFHWEKPWDEVTPLPLVAPRHAPS